MAYQSKHRLGSVKPPAARSRAGSGLETCLSQARKKRNLENETFPESMTVLSSLGLFCFFFLSVFMLKQKGRIRFVATELIEAPSSLVKSVTCPLPDSLT